MKRVSRKIVAMLSMLVLCLSVLFVPDMGNTKAAESISLSGKAHVQTFADQNGKLVSQGGIQTLVLGTRGMAKRVESVTVNLKNNTGYAGTLQYRVHRQTYGWTAWLNAGQAAGTHGEGKRLEAIEMRLTGELAKYYDVRYRAHIQTYGDNQGWVYNGALAGTTGEAKRLEEICVQIVPKKSISEEPSIAYRVHRQTYGWEKNWATDGTVSGTVGQAKRLEGISITVNDNQYSGGVTYRTHVQSYGWRDWVSNGEMSGTQGEAKRLEAIEIKLTGELSQYYDVYYRVHAQSYGWLGWAKNGESAGTAGFAKRLEAIQIVVLKKGALEYGSGNYNSSLYKMMYEGTYKGVKVAEDSSFLSYTQPYVDKSEVSYFNPLKVGEAVTLKWSYGGTITIKFAGVDYKKCTYTLEVAASEGSKVFFGEEHFGVHEDFGVSCTLNGKKYTNILYCGGEPNQYASVKQFGDTKCTMVIGFPQKIYDENTGKSVSITDPAVKDLSIIERNYLANDKIIYLKIK